jgi:hypothetical protein
MALKNRVVVRTRDKRRIRGFTWDFAPNKETFHVVDPFDERNVEQLALSDLKAIFYVKSFVGEPGRDNPPAFSKESFKGIPGLKLKITFVDGEVMYGTTNGYQPDRQGFFVMPADKDSNNERVYVIQAATKSVETWR